MHEHHHGQQENDVRNTVVAQLMLAHSLRHWPKFNLAFRHHHEEGDWGY